MVVIPARYGSTRLPAKLLADLCGHPVIWHTWQKAQASGVGRVVVTTDHADIATCITDGGGEVVMVEQDCPSGTDRIALACMALGLPPGTIVVNLQGDEPGMPSQAIAQVVSILEQAPDCAMATLCVPLIGSREAQDPAVVKVVCNAQGRALYFSRAPIPVSRDGGPVARFRHVGLYAYRLEALLELTALPPAPVELAESLEQLRALWHGMAIAVGEAVCDIPRGIDTPEDLARWRGMDQGSVTLAGDRR